ncbi:cation acetate symporter [Streptomyces sp. NPDC056405]|uniref:sodium:solute symporter family transporter n=1 Tax=Streptomyces sp. NPDC056405 TaxID=3345811 RepID=UPI0035DD2C04
MTPPASVPLGAGTFADAAPLTAFLLVISLTLLLCLLLGANSHGIEDMYASGHSVRPWTNALALTGDSISVITLLSTTGLVALAAYDGTILAAATAGALGFLLVLARPLRDAGRFTLGDTLDARFADRGIRVAATAATLCVCLPLAVVQLTAAGRATAALVGMEGTAWAQWCTIFIGAMTVCAATLTGMRGNTVLQAVKTVVLFLCMGLLVVVLMARTGWSPDRLLADAAEHSPVPGGYYAPGVAYGTDLAGRLDLVSLQLTVLLGAAVVPHMIMRVKTADSGASARRSVVHAIGMVGVFCVLAVILGLGASAFGDGQRQGRFDPQSAASLLQLVKTLGAHWGGGLLVAATVSAVFLTSLTVVAALTLSAGAALVNDIYAQRSRSGRVAKGREVRAMRWAIPAVGVGAVALSIGAQNWNIDFLAQFAVSAAASAIAPALVFALFWSRCTRAGIVWSIYTGLGTTAVLQFFGTAVSGAPGTLFPSADFNWFPLGTTGLVSIPAGFTAGWVASRLTSAAPTQGRGAPAQW